MKKLHKNFRTMKQTVESMACACGTGCPCTDVSNYYGYIGAINYTASVQG
jgi:putative bacteriocin precursor